MTPPNRALILPRLTAIAVALLAALTAGASAQQAGYFQDDAEVRRALAEAQPQGGAVFAAVQRGSLAPQTPFLLSSPRA